MDTAGITVLSANSAAAAMPDADFKTAHAHAHARETPDLSGNCWRLEPHVCSQCYARIVSTALLGSGKIVFRCTNCGRQGKGDDASVICACGIKLRKPVTGRAVGKPFYDAGIRCIENPKLSPEFPSLYVASYVGTKKGGKS